jgi:hypothetical protein
MACALFVELALGDLRRAADLFAPVHQATAGVDGRGRSDDRSAKKRRHHGTMLTLFLFCPYNLQP